MLDARRLRGGVRREGALGLVVTADTRVLVAEVYGVVAEADRLIEGERVIELAVDKNVVARRFQIERACRESHVEMWRVTTACADGAWARATFV